MEVGQIALPPPDPPDSPDPPKPTLSKFERFMLGVAIVLPTVDNYTDVNFGVRLLTGLYDQGWICQRKIPPTRYDEIDLNQNFSYEEFIKFSDTDPTNNDTIYNCNIIERRPQIALGSATLSAVALSFIFMAVQWFKLENTWMKKLKTLPILLLHFFPQYRAFRVLYFWWKGDTEKWSKEKLVLERDISSIEPIAEAIPQVFIQVAVMVSTRGIIDPYGSLFLLTFLTSLLTATLGMAKFFKSGPIQLVPRDSYGCGFFTIMLLMASHIILKA